MPTTTEHELIRQLFALPEGQKLLREWKMTHCQKTFTSDALRLARNAGVSDFINSIEVVLNHGR